MVAQTSNPVIQPHQYRHLNPSLLTTNRLLPRILTNIGRSPCASSASSSSCASSPATTHTSTDFWGLIPQKIACKPDPPPGRRKKASRACGHCQKAHLTCDDGRPCLRCIKRGLTKTCADGVRKKAKYLSDYDDALLVRPRPVAERTSEDILPFEDCKKVKAGASDQDGPLSISWAEIDLSNNVGISQYATIETQALAEEMLDGNALNQVRSLGGLEEWLAGFECSPSTRNEPSIDLMNVETNVNQTSKPNHTRKRMQQWIERVEKLVEIRKLIMNITADDEWMLKRNLDRSLMELERIMSLSGTPTIIWSTSGEILKVGDEFCMLTEWRREELIGRHIEDIFEPESLEEYLDLVEASIFPDQKIHRNQLADHHPSQNSKSSCQVFQQRSSSTSSFCLSLPASPSLSSDQLVPMSHVSKSASGNKERQLTQTIKLFAVRKACGQESIGCSFCFRVSNDL